MKSHYFPVNSLISRRHASLQKVPNPILPVDSDIPLLSSAVDSLFRDMTVSM